MAPFDGEIMDLFSTDLPERKKRVVGEKNGILVATGPGPRQIEVTGLHFVL